jgi:hypothetical protein
MSVKAPGRGEALEVHGGRDADAGARQGERVRRRIERRIVEHRLRLFRAGERRRHAATVVDDGGFQLRLLQAQRERLGEDARGAAREDDLIDLGLDEVGRRRILVRA